MELRLEVTNIFLCDLQRNMDGILIEENGESVTTIFACINDDDRSHTGRTLEIREEKWKKEMRKTG